MTRCLVRSGSMRQPNKYPSSVGWWMASFLHFYSSQGFFSFSFRIPTHVWLSKFTPRLKRKTSSATGFKTRRLFTEFGLDVTFPLQRRWKMAFHILHAAHRRLCSEIRRARAREKKRGPWGPPGFFQLESPLRMFQYKVWNRNVASGRSKSNVTTASVWA